MAEPAHAAEGADHGVRYEHSDVNPKDVLLFAAALVGGLVVIVLVLWGLFHLFAARELPRKQTDLPPAAVDGDRTPPGPVLEGIEDVREKRYEAWPPRAERSLGPQGQQLAEGKAAGALPIDRALDELAGKLPAGKAAPPPNYLRRLPSKASAGRSETGGQ